jgi:hypothetical protein
MRKLVLSGLGLCLLAVVALAGGDPWKKPFGEWTDKDVALIQQNSPWAKILQAQGAWRPDGMTQASGSAGIAGSSSDRSKNSDSASPETAGGAAKNASAAAATATYSVWWWSSRMIRAASFRDAVLKGKMTQADAEKDVAQPMDEYEILVRATNMIIFQQRGEKAFESAAYLQIKKAKTRISPSHVAFLKGPDGQSVVGAVFYFPKKTANGEPAISPEEKEVDFYLQVGDAKLITYFEPKKMVDTQGTDL